MTGLPSGTVTFLFTDLEESTRLWDQFPEEMRDALARHDELLRGGIERNHGQVVKTTGDGVYAVFTSAPDAVAAATHVMRALYGERWGATGPLKARMALHTGTADERDGDYFGPALNRASRLMSSAHGGQVVLSQASAELVREHLPKGLALQDLGEHRFKGLARPEQVYELVIEGMPSEFPPLQSLDARPGAIDLPEPSFARGATRLTGRTDELDQLLAAWEQAERGTRQIALIGGEPGIGKTRLADELSRHVHARSGVVLYGRCDEETIVPYQPFVEAMRLCVAEFTPTTLRQRLRGLERDLARVFPELAGRVDGGPTPAGTDPEAERYRLFEAVAVLLTGIAAAQPTLLVVDDLHWADPPTLQLLRHVVRATSRSQLLVLVAFRDVELLRDQPPADLVADLAREPGVTRLSLRGLSKADSGTLVNALAGYDVTVSVVGALHRETDGNPFFLEELVCHLRETGALDELEATGAEAVDLHRLGLPEGVRDVVTRRLRRLPDSVSVLLTTAAVIGPEFDAELLGRALGQSATEVLAGLDQAAEAGLVGRDPGRMGRYTFTHAVIRDALHVPLGAADDARLHSIVGEAIEASPAGHPAAELALHFTKAIPILGVTKAIEYTAQAGDEAVASVAFEDAVAAYERALTLLQQHTPEDRSQRVDLLTDLAGALVYVDEQAGVDAARDAIAAARVDGTPAQFGRAVAVFVEPLAGVVAYPGEVIQLFDEAQSVLGSAEPALRARLRGFESFKYASYQLRGKDPRVLAADAVALARDTGDGVVLTDALLALAASYDGEPDVALRVALGEELVGLTPVAGARAEAFGRRVLAEVALETGDAPALAATVDRLVDLADEERWLWARVYAAQWEATRALVEGRFDDAEKRIDDLRRHARGYRAATSMHAVQAFQLMRERGELGDVGSFEATASEHEATLLTWAMIAAGQLDAGHELGAAQHLERMFAEEFHRREPDGRSPAGLAYFAEVAATVGAVEPAALLYDLLRPFHDRLLTVVLGLACIGAADRYLGMLATTLDRFDDAASHFEHALALEERVHGHALVPRTSYWLARLEIARGDVEDGRARARAVVDAASSLGMTRLRDQAAALADS